MYMSYMDELCRSCENNCGGACAYDLADEAEWRGVKLERLRLVKMEGQDSYCAYFERRSKE